MKISLTSKVILALATFSFLPIAGMAQRHHENAFAVVYTDSHFQGWSYRILPGDSIHSFRRIQDGRWTFLNRNIESIEIHGEMSLELWNSRSFNGDSVLITESVANLSRLNWSNQTVSINATHFQAPPPPIEPPPERPRHRAPRRGEVILFENSDFRGEALVFDHSINIPELDEYFRETASWNDIVSSIAINGNYTVTVFEHAYFQGKSASIHESTTSVSQLLDQNERYGNWNDKISSIKIERNRHGEGRPDNAKPSVATLFDHDKFRGSSLSLFAGQEIQDLDDISWNDKASSLQVDSEFIIILYEHSNFRGKSVRISNEQTNLNYTRTDTHRIERWNDKASSLKVIRK